MSEKTSDTDRIVDEWFQNHIQNSPASRDEQVYAHLYHAKDALKAALNSGNTTPEADETIEGGN